MPKTRNVHCLVEVERRPRRLFSIAETPHGDIIIGFQTAFKMGAGLGGHYAGHIIKSQKHTIHPSLDSLSGTNLIHHTCIFANGTKFDEVHYTEAIKQHGRFAHISTVRCPNLNLEQYIPKNRAIKQIILGRFDPNATTLFYSIFVGAAGQKFPRDWFDDMNVELMDFQLFRVVVLWSFAAVFSDPTGSKVHTFTVRPETALEPIRLAVIQTMAGYSINECADIFRKTRELLFDQYMNFLASLDFGGEEMISTARLLGHSKIDRLGEIYP